MSGHIIVTNVYNDTSSATVYLANSQTSQASALGEKARTSLNQKPNTKLRVTKSKGNKISFGLLYIHS